MKYILIDEKHYEVPESWKDISLLKFQKLFSSRNTKLSPEEMIVNTVSVLTDCPIDVCRKIKYSDLYSIAELFAWAKDVDSIFDIEGKEAQDMVFNIDGKLYAFDKTFQITLGQNIDADNIMKDDANFYENVHRLLAIILRPASRRGFFHRKGLKKKLLRLIKKSKNTISGEIIESLIEYDVEQYDASQIENRAKLFQERLSAADAIRTAFFLSSLNVKLMNSIPGYGKQNLKEQEKALQETSQKDGAGIQSLDSLLTGTSPGSMKY